MQTPSPSPASPPPGPSHPPAPRHRATPDVALILLALAAVLALLAHLLPAGQRWHHRANLDWDFGNVSLTLANSYFSGYRDLTGSVRITPNLRLRACAPAC